MSSPGGRGGGGVRRRDRLPGRGGDHPRTLRAVRRDHGGEHLGRWRDWHGVRLRLLCARARRHRGRPVRAHGAQLRHREKALQPEGP